MLSSRVREDGAAVSPAAAPERGDDHAEQRERERQLELIVQRLLVDVARDERRQDDGGGLTTGRQASPAGSPTVAGPDSVAFSANPPDRRAAHLRRGGEAACAGRAELPPRR